MRHNGGDRQWAEDVVQETFLRAWRHTQGLLSERGSRSMMPWLVTVARRIVLNNRRSRGARPLEVDDTYLSLVAVPDETERTLLRTVLTEALAELTPAHRTVVVEMCVHERTTTEVSDLIGIPCGTVKSRMYYALRALRAALEDRGVAVSARSGGGRPAGGDG
jgi:RNA polymerase sigma-70 factor (ECF subfamily)